MDSGPYQITVQLLAYSVYVQICYVRVCHARPVRPHTLALLYLACSYAPVNNRGTVLTLCMHPCSPLPPSPFPNPPHYSSSQSVEGERVPSSLLLSFQFFSFPPTTSRARLVRSKEGGSSQLPLILQPADSENQVGISVRRL